MVFLSPNFSTSQLPYFSTLLLLLLKRVTATSHFRRLDATMNLEILALAATWAIINS
jgi:hypothetical protein